MFRYRPVHLRAALLALVALLLLATVPTLGRVMASTAAEPAVAGAVRTDRGATPAEHEHHRSRIAEGEGATPPLHAAEDCVYCVLLGALAPPVAQGPHFAVPRAPHTPVGRVRAAPATTQPLSTLGSRGPPRAAA